MGELPGSVPHGRNVRVSGFEGGRELVVHALITRPGGVLNGGSAGNSRAQQTSLLEGDGPLETPPDKWLG